MKSKIPTVKPTHNFSPDPGYISNGAIAGIAVGGAVAIVVIICLTICFVKSRQHKKKTMVNVDVGNTDIGMGNLNFRSLTLDNMTKFKTGSDESIFRQQNN